MMWDGPLLFELFLPIYNNIKRQELKITCVACPKFTICIVTIVTFGSFNFMPTIIIIEASRSQIWIYNRSR
jgi:hypothetical protein